MSRRIALLLLGLAAATAGFDWLCFRDPSINFLPAHPAAEWILFPNAVEIGAHNVASFDTLFRREFTLTTAPRSARLRVRAARRVEVKINGASVELASGSNWKDASETEVPALLRTGINVIEARVFHDTGPPALWLSLTIEDVNVRSDETWRASFAGSAWRTAALASQPRMPGPGNSIAGGEATLSSLRIVWPMWLAVAVVAAGILVGGRWWFAGAQNLPRKLTAVLLAIAALWLLLFLHNNRLLPMHAGFDSQAHIDYISYLQEHRALPWPNDGVQMFQPPLFYLFSAGVLALVKVPATTAAGVLIVRTLTMLFGIAHFIAVFLSLRLLWPERVGPPLVGLVLAAFLPMNLYLSHYCTNETLAALLVSLSVYQCVRILQRRQASWFQVTLLGLTSGAAALTKFTAFLAWPFIFGALAAQLLSRGAPARQWLKVVAVPAIAALASGWHYLRVARHAGSLVIGGWDPASGFAWWQEDGYHTASYFLHFGESLVHPFFAGSASFADGIYSTLWGDGLCGGVSAIFSRLPWNYNLMAAGYLLAVVPTLLILFGAGLALVEWTKRGGTERFLLVGFGFAIVCGLIYVNLKVPAYASAKAFYGLSALTPLAFFGALAWDRWTHGWKGVQFAIAAVLLVWAMNSFASMWIRESGSQLVYRGLRSLEQPANDALSAWRQAVAREPSNATARRLLASLLQDSGQLDEALEQAERAVELSPIDAACHLQLASVLDAKGERERPIAEIRRALELGAEDPNAHQMLAFWLLRNGATEDASVAARNGLAIAPFSADLHYSLALAVARTGEFAQAANQFAYALLLRPTWPEARTNLHQALTLSIQDRSRLRKLEETAPDSPTLLGELAWLLATDSDASARDGPAALRVAERAVGLTNKKNPELLATLAAAYAETGRFPDASRTAQDALAVARANGDEQAATVARKLIASFGRGEAYRETPSP